MQSPMARAMGTGRGAAVGRLAEGALRLGDAARRAYRSMPARVPGEDLSEIPARSSMPPPNNLPDMEPPPYEEVRRPRPQQRRAAPRRNEDPEGTEAAADAERERQRAMTPAEERSFFERLGIRRTNETGMDPATIAHRRNYLGESGATASNMSMNKKGGLIKAKEAYKKGGLVKPKKAAPIKAKAASPAKLKGKTMMKKGGMAKGGEAGLASSLRGGVVKKPGTESFNFQAKKMATGGVVQKGGNKYGFSNAKTKMLRRGGMAKGCK
jgi:hypothetical protein